MRAVVMEKYPALLNKCFQENGTLLLNLIEQEIFIFLIYFDYPKKRFSDADRQKQISHS